MTADSDATRGRLRDIEREIFARRPEHDIKPTLDRITELVTLLGDPQHACPVIHVAGTNGKTSTARMIETLLRARGLRTGLFTSPHLTSVTERIQIDGEPLTAEAFAAAYSEVAPYAALTDERQPFRLSFFELLTGMAFSAFADAPVDVAVVEVGIGGTWDATNIADGAVAVVTPVAIDHVGYLGATIEQIAGEKAGIIKPGSRAVLGHQGETARLVLRQRAQQVGAPVISEGTDFGVTARELAVGGQRLEIQGLGGAYTELLLPAFGEHQAANSACALAAVEAFSEAGKLDGELVRQAFGLMTTPGRLEVVRRSPVVIVDAAHNPAGMAASLAAVVEAFGFHTLVAVLAVSGDKDVTGILDQLEPATSYLVVTRNASDRSMPVSELAQMAGPVFGPDRVSSAARLDDAITEAVRLADEATASDRPGAAGVLVTGSVITAGQARALLGAGKAGARDQG